MRNRCINIYYGAKKIALFVGILAVLGIGLSLVMAKSKPAGPTLTTNSSPAATLNARSTSITNRAMTGKAAAVVLPIDGFYHRVTTGQQIAVLGAGFSKETDGERKHLHFALVRGSIIDFRGYVQNASSLSKWIDPVEWFNSLNAVT